MIARLKAAFRKLPITAAYPDKIPYESVLPGICRELVRLSATPPRGKPAKELAELKKHAEKLLNAIVELHKPALDAAVVPDGLTMRLGVLIAQIDEAKLGGRPRKDQAWEITKMTAETFYRLTGGAAHPNTKDGKAYGPFLDLLTEVFNILGVDASPESQARRLRKDKTSV
jgi:hypothetical protein